MLTSSSITRQGTSSASLCRSRTDSSSSQPPCAHREVSKAKERSMFSTRDGHHLLGTSERIRGEFLHDEEKHQLVMIMPTPSSATRSCFFRDHLVSPRQWLLSRYDRILELVRFNAGQQARALLGTGHVFESSTARSLLLASSSDSNSERSKRKQRNV